MAKKWHVSVYWNGGSSANLLTNGNYESDVAGWTNDGNGDAVARSTLYSRFGDASLVMGDTTVAFGNAIADTQRALVSGTTYTGSMWFYIRDTAPTLTNATLRFMTTGFAVKASANFLTQANATRNQWFRVSVTWTADASATFIFGVIFAATTSHQEYVDGAQVEVGSTPTPYYDGTVGDESDGLMEITIERGRKTIINAGGNGFAPQQVGEATLTLRNTDGRYDPLNTSSPLYPNVAPGKVVTIRFEDGAEYGMLTGHIYDIRPIGNAQSRRVQMIVRDGWQWLKDRKVTVAPNPDAQTDFAIGYLCAAAEYPFSQSEATGDDTIPYWWADNQDAMGQIQSLTDSELGITYIATDGTLTFKARSAQYLTASSVSISGDGANGDLNELNFAQPWDVVRNYVQVKVYPTDIIPNGTGVPLNDALWKSTKPIKLRPLQSVTLNVKYTYAGKDTSAYNLIQPVATTDYQAFENANGTGNNMTVYVSVLLTENGTEANLVLTNGNPNLVAHVTLLKVRGDVINKTDALTVETDSSDGGDKRTFLLDVPWQQDIENAQLYADYLASLLKNPRGNPVLRSNRNTAKQCLELSTVLTLTVTAQGIANVYRVEGVSHHWSAQSPNILDTKLYCGTKDETSYWIIGTSTFDDQTVLAF